MLLRSPLLPKVQGIPIANKHHGTAGHTNRWIAGAVSHPGAETAAAAKAGETTHQYMEQHKGDSGTAGKRARLGLTLSKLSKRK